MPISLKRNAVIVFALSGLFYWVFMFAKHSPSLRDVIPFGIDPYDSVGSFGVIVGILMALLSLFRAFRPFSNQRPSVGQHVYLLRSQHAVILAVLISIAADGVAMTRHPRQWVGTAARTELFALLAGLAAVTFAVLHLIQNSQPESAKTGPTFWGKALWPALLAISVLVVYPERLVQNLATHLLTIVVGILVLFAPMPKLLNALVPYQPGTGEPQKAHFNGATVSTMRRWGMVLVLGTVVGMFAFMGEMSEGTGSQNLLRLLFVGSVFVGLSVTGIGIAYSFLSTPLGLGSRD